MPDYCPPQIILSGELFSGEGCNSKRGHAISTVGTGMGRREPKAYSAGICGVGDARKGAVALCVRRVQLSTGQVVSRGRDELNGARYSLVWISYPKYRNKHFFDNHESAFTREPFRYRGLTISGMLLESRIGIILVITKHRGLN